MERVVNVGGVLEPDEVNVRGVLELEWPYPRLAEPCAEAWRFVAGRPVTGNALAEGDISLSQRTFSTALHAFGYLLYREMRPAAVFGAYADAFAQPGTAAEAVERFQRTEGLGLGAAAVRAERRRVMRAHGVHTMAFALAAKFLAQPWCVHALAETRGTLVAGDFSLWRGRGNALGKLYMQLRCDLRAWLRLHGEAVTTMTRPALRARLIPVLETFVQRYA